MFVLDYDPQPKQLKFHSTPARLVLYGGAVGGGKSHAIRWDAIAWCLQVPGIQVYIFRRTLGELYDNHIKQIQVEIPQGPEGLGTYNDTHKRFDFKGGSSINFCYCEHEKDVLRYQGGEIHVLLLDEASQFTEYQISYLIGRNRLGRFRQRVPEQFRHLLPRAAFGSNPGGPGHNFLKEVFIDPAPPGELFYSPKFRDPKKPDDPGRLTTFIPARMDDNIYLDGDYSASLAGLPPELQKALKDGDWDAVVGQALPQLSRDPFKGHLLRPFTPPRHWTRFTSIDWGTAKPFSIGWYCVSDGALLAERDGYPERWLPSGAVIRYAEWYGWDGKADKGSYMESPEVARGIIQREAERNEPPMDYRVGDSAMWARSDGPCVAEKMRNVDPRLAMKPSKKDREHNYRELIDRLGVEDGERMFFVTTNCTHFWRTVPSLTLDQINPEKGPDTKLEDHVYDEVVYALRSRPFTVTAERRADIEYRRQLPKKSQGYYAT